jgi:hypothetical protein
LEYLEPTGVNQNYAGGDETMGDGDDKLPVTSPHMDWLHKAVFVKSQ